MMNRARAGERLLKVGEVACLTGLSVKALHHYEERGLAEPVGRTETGYRLYGEEAVARLKFIKLAKLLGLTLEEIRELVSLAAGCNRGEILPRLEDVLEEKLEETKRKMGELAAFKESLLYYRERLAEADPEGSCDLETSFCGCLEAATGEGSAVGFEDAEEGQVAG
ncbi:MAG TPA: MerR family transcriptional regulator [Rubrobacter sp.]|nr:MerR family transcriptional regulator [Rubrobacter sp.]